MTKNVVFKIVTWLFIIALVAIVPVYFISKFAYQKKIDKLSERSGSLEYVLIFEEFFSSNFRYPIDEREFYDYFSKDTSVYLEVIRKMKDPFSSNNNSFQYVPIYSKSNRLCEGYLLISAGIDGVSNFEMLDTVYFENVKDNFFYNTLDIATSLSYRNYTPVFSLKDYFFGSKDLLIEFTNGLELFINNASRRVYSPSSLMKKLYPRGFTSFDCCIEGVVKKIDNNSIVITDTLSSVVCMMYKGKSFDIKEFEKVKIVGQYRNQIDTTNKTIYLKNCIIFDRDTTKTRLQN